MPQNRKVYLVTRRAGYNFGSSLQAYALQQIFLSRGFSCEILDVKEMRFRGRFRISILNVLANVLKCCTILSQVVGKARYTQIQESYKQRKKFDRFNTKTLVISSKKLHSDKALALYIGEGNLIVCGSDQIWNPLGFSPTMFLSFANPQKNILAAYAPSFGLSAIGEMHKEEITHLVNRFHHLSTREEAGVQILNELTQKPVSLVLDPTLVVDSTVWSKIEEPITVTDRPYILCYFLSTENHPIDFVEDLRKKYGLEVINLQTNYSTFNWPGVINRSDIGPGNFLHLISNAAYVCTNSFHCCIFSHIYKKEFFVFSRFTDSDKANQNSRIETLLKILGEEERWMDSSQITVNNQNNCLLSNILKCSNKFIDRL